MSSHRSKPAHYEEPVLGIKLDEIIGELPYWLGAALETRENNDFILYRSLSRYLVQLHWEEKKEAPSLNEEGN